jgi:hypothetical protein
MIVLLRQVRRQIVNRPYDGAKLIQKRFFLCTEGGRGHRLDTHASPLGQRHWLIEDDVPFVNATFKRHQRYSPSL